MFFVTKSKPMKVPASTPFLVLAILSYSEITSNDLAVDNSSKAEPFSFLFFVSNFTSKTKGFSKNALKDAKLYPIKF